MNSCMILTSAQSFIIGCFGCLLMFWAIVRAVTAGLMETRKTRKSTIIWNKLSASAIGSIGLMIILWLIFGQDICSNLIQIRGL